MTKEKKIKMLIAGTILIDVIGFGIVIPLLPFYVRQFSVSPLAVTLLFSVYSLCSFFSAPFLGALSDKYGRRPVLIASIVSTAIGWLVFALANSLWLLFLGRIIDGLAAGNFSTAQSALSDLAKDEKERAVNLGLAGALFGIGFILGPLLGGLLGLISARFVFFFVAALASANALWAWRALPETNSHLHAQAKISFNPFLPLKKAILDHKIRPAYGVWFLFSLAAASQQSVFALYMGKIFSFNQTGVGLIMTGIGVVIVFNQGFGLKKFWLKRFSQGLLRLGAPLFFGLSLLMLATQSLWIYLAGLFVGSFAQSILRVTVTSEAVSAADPKRRGEVMGIMTSLNSLGMIIGPLIAGAAFVAHDMLAYYLGAVCMLIAFLIAWGDSQRRQPIASTDIPMPDTI
ncbi:MAG: MFS transporter [Candidatus Falkowbacteria bacterium]